MRPTTNHPVIAPMAENRIAPATVHSPSNPVPAPNPIPAIIAQAKLALIPGLSLPQRLPMIAPLIIPALPAGGMRKIDSSTPDAILQSEITPRRQPIAALLSILPISPATEPMTTLLRISGLSAVGSALFSRSRPIRRSLAQPHTRARPDTAPACGDDALPKSGQAAQKRAPRCRPRHTAGRHQRARPG
jgi:hypothetical protein